MARSVDDPQLGSLERRRGRWRGAVLVDGRPVPLAVIGGRGGPDPRAVALAKRVGAELSAARAALEAALVEHREPSGETAATWSVAWVSAAPIDGRLVLELGLDVAWDEEHTLGARLRDGSLVELNGSVLAP